MSDKEWEIFKEKVQPIKASGKVKYERKRSAINLVQKKEEVKESFDKINLDEQSKEVRQIDKNVLKKIKKDFY